MNPLLALALWILAAFTQDGRQPAAYDVAALRGEGPVALGRLLERFDGLGPGIERDSLERAIDAVAGQRYATVSRLYWHTDFEAARDAAHASRKPILSLRMLGRLDEDLSCANSRYFRIVLYADPDVARFLRENFTLHWSTERPVPRVTIDFRDGRRIETTIAGNSAHYVLDADGHPIDVLPGLYSPAAFQRELESVLPLARSSPSLSTDDRLVYVREHHVDRLQVAADLWSKGPPPTIVRLPIRPGIVRAEGLSPAKSFAETPVLLAARLAARLGGARAEDLVGPGDGAVVAVRRLEESRLSGTSRNLLARLGPIDWSPDPRPLAGEAFERAIANLEVLVAVDTESNEVELRSQIHRWFAAFALLPDFETLNELVYRELFRMPREDPWLGLANPGSITGLPRDGVSR
jgi:hypothetical protein